MRIGGLQRCSLIDYPGKTSAILFTLGCNFRCPYCHNPELVDETATEIPLKEILLFLTKRQNLLDAVTITGGEPTMHNDLIPFLQHIRSLGFLIKLDTNGTNPNMLTKIIERRLIDYVAMDIKAPLSAYSENVARAVDVEAIQKSIEIILNSSVEYEFRTTVVKSLLSPRDLEEIGKTIQGAKRYYLQKFVPNKILNPQFIKKTTYTDEEFEEFRSVMETYVDTCQVR